MRRALYLLIATAIILSCSTGPDETQENIAPPLREEAAPDPHIPESVGAEGILICASPEERSYELSLSHPLADRNQGFSLMVQFFEGEQVMSGWGGRVNRDRTLYQFVSGYAPVEGKTDKVLVFLDENGNFRKDQGESSAVLQLEKINALTRGVSFFLPGLEVKTGADDSREVSSLPQSFVFPRLEDVRIYSPPGFEKREGERGIGIKDYSLNATLWFYRDTTLEQISELMGKEPDEEWLRGGPGMGTFKYDMVDGGFILFAFDEGGLWMVYPRKTHWFSPDGFPRLPWDRETVDDIFGFEVAVYLTESHRGEEIFPFEISPMDEPEELPAFRLDIAEEADLVNGFRCRMPSADILSR